MRRSAAADRRRRGYEYRGRDRPSDHTPAWVLLAPDAEAGTSALFARTRALGAVATLTARFRIVRQIVLQFDPALDRLPAASA
jgi:hypothetical protein